jgi:hypothetical protein
MPERGTEESGRWLDCLTATNGGVAMPLRVSLRSILNGRAIAQVVSRRLPTAAARVRAQVTSCGICAGQSGIGAVFSEYFGFPAQFPVHQSKCLIVYAAKLRKTIHTEILSENRP